MGKNKLRRLLACFLFVLLLVPSLLPAKTVYIKFSVGYFSGGSVSDRLSSAPEYLDYLSVGKAEQLKPGLDFSMEFIYQINKYLSFCLGNGYSSKLLKGETALYQPPGYSVIYSAEPEISVEIIPIYLNAIISLPLYKFFQLHFFGGLGYYFCTLESQTKWSSGSFLPGTGMKWSYESTNFKTSRNTFGLRTGLSANAWLSEIILFNFEVLYNSIKLRNIETLGDSQKDSSLYFIRTSGKGLTCEPFGYSVDLVNLSGFAYRLGLALRF